MRSTRARPVLPHMAMLVAMALLLGGCGEPANERRIERLEHDFDELEERIEELEERRE